MNRPTTWKLVTLGAALTGLGVTGAGFATAADGVDRAAAPRAISVVDADVRAAAVPLPAALPAVAADDSAESVDSPWESPVDSVDSPFDSPDDGPGAPSPDADGSPEHPDDTIDGADDSADDSADHGGDDTADDSGDGSADDTADDTADDD